MPHNMTVTIDDELWKEMKKHNDVRWSAVMRDAAKKRLEAIKILKNIADTTPLGEEEIHNIAIKWSKELRNRK